MTTQDATADDSIGDPADEARLMTHAYDGIREYDNPLPGWWRATFWLTIVFAAGYAFYFQFSGWGRTIEQRYRASIIELGVRSGGGGIASTATEESLALQTDNDTILKRGASVFASRCAGCHTADGRGLIGPNLTDLFQIHGSSRVDIYNVVAGGVPGTAMVAWASQLSGSEVNAVTAYVIVMRGKDLPGKPPQGKPVGAFGKP